MRSPLKPDLNPISLPEKKSMSKDSQDDPWAELSPEQRKRAQRHLWILYAAMIIMGILPFIAFFLLRN